ncbi:putative ribonuclease H-like domain-containing protein [Tanacetum coccineum]
MELENTQNNALAKLPMLKLGEYKMWQIRIKQYFHIQDYALWEVIENRNSWVPIPVTTSETGTSTATKMIVPSTIEEKTCKKNDVQSCTNNTNTVNPEVSTATSKVNTASTEISTASFSDATKNVIEVEPKKVRKNNDAPIIEDLVLDDKEQDGCPNQQRKRIVSGNNYNKKDNDYYSKTSHPSAHKHMAPRAVLMKTGLKSFNIARPINTVRSVNTGRPFSTARPFRSTVNTVRARGFNAVKPSACWVWRPIKPNGASLSNSQLNDKGFVDSGCSRHMTGNIAHLSDFKDFDGGYVTFGGGAYGGRITGKGTIKTDNLDFDDVYFVKELKFNLFSVSQMCDKKNYVLFTDSECLVLSPNFKLPDENQILLKIPRQDNMYSFDMKNIVPKDSLTCLVAKATSEESMLWHRRLGHINFKNINKLVKENLVRDLPLKRFENDQTCVACLKGKQHRASCKTKAFNPITKPLFMLHMDLFGPTFVSSLMHKKYCLVVTDDYSRFSWVFFLTTKDETKAVSTACYVKNRVLIVKPHNKTPYELFRGIKLAIGFMKPFRCHVTILNTLDKLGKFDGKSDEGIQGVYKSSTSSQQDQDWIAMPIWKDASYFSDALPNIVVMLQIEIQQILYWFRKKDQEIELGNIPQSYEVPTTPHTRIHKDHPIEHVIGDVQSSVQTRRMKTSYSKKGFLSAIYEGKTHQDLHTCLFVCFLSQEEPKRVSQALRDPAWVEAMQEELLQFKLQKVWILVDLPKGHRAIGTKWVYRNKKDERGIVIRNKARLVAQGHTQEIKRA